MRPRDSFLLFGTDLWDDHEDVISELIRKFYKNDRKRFENIIAKAYGYKPGPGIFPVCKEGDYDALTRAAQALCFNFQDYANLWKEK